MNILLLQYNNYLNRQVKIEGELISDYTPYVVDYRYNVNFNENDGVDTTLIVNTTNKADYLICYEEDEVISRWFILEQQRQRNGQYLLTLKRDVVADNYNAVLDSTCFVEKGFLNDSNPLIFNKEGLQVNQIKQSETFIKDASNCAWIVGYTDPKAGEKLLPSGSTDQFYRIQGDVITEDPDLLTQNITTWQYYKYTSGSHVLANSYRIGFRIQSDSDKSTFQTADGNRIIPKLPPYLVSNTGRFYGTGWKDSLSRFDDGHVEAYDALTNSITYEEYLNIIKLQGKSIFDTGSGKLYTINVNATTKLTSKRILRTNDGSVIFSDFIGAFPNETTPATDNIGLTYEETSISIELTQVYNSSKEVFLNWPKTTEILNDAPYTMFAIPYNPEGNYEYYGVRSSTLGNGIINISKQMAIGIANLLGNTFQSGKYLYDLQLLPFCPFMFTTRNGKLDSTAILNKVEVIDTTTEATRVGAIFFCKSSTFDTNIPLSISVDNVKESNELDKYRIVAPNFSTFDEFSAAKNGGVDFIHADCTYLPFQPYIQLHINYKNLYGQDFEDARGLLCGGDYSLPLLSDAWQNYQINNKNYGAIFDREMQHLDVEQQWGMAEAVVGAISGTAQGAAAGALLGGGVGAAVGGVLSAGAGIADIAKTAAMQRENKSLKKDMHEYSLQNVQALPSGLAKTTGFKNNNKVFPFIERYSCTEEEREAFRNLIKYNGMTVNKIGTLKDYINTTDESFVKGQVIRIQINDDYHLATEINNTLSSGIYIKGE